jgi:carbonic anhydrase/acetyltransferase-like protein (isoleucine patch superfamily)
MRAAAGFGVRAVRADSDNLIASAWDQFQQLRQANQRLRQFQLARVVAQTTLTRQVNALEGAGSFLQLTQPMHTRLRITLGITATVNALVTASRISAGAVVPAFRRMARRRGPLGRQLFAVSAPPSQFVERLNQVAGTPRALAIVAPIIAPAGTVLLDTVSPSTTAALLTATAVAAAPGWTATAVTTGTITTGTIVATDTAVTSGTHITTGTVIANRATIATGTPIAAAVPIASETSIAAGAPIAVGTQLTAGTIASGLTLTTPEPPLRVATNLQDDPGAPTWLRTGIQTFPRAPVFPTILSDYVQMEARFRAAATLVVNYINDKTALISDEPELPPLSATLATAQTLMVSAVDPTKTLAVRAGAQLLLPSTGDPLRPQIGAPVFTQPMSLALTPQQMLPGAEAVPDETAALLVTNPRFVEGYMVGLNDEMRRELAWRQYPVVSNATFFANFWGNTADIPPIAAWAATASLGTSADTHNAQTVLLVRGELLRRFPNTVITAVPAAGTTTQRQLGTTEITPSFRGNIDPDMTFFGFPFTEATATAGLGYYFILAEHPSEPRFGLAATAAGSGTTLTDWNDLAWSQVTVVNNHVSVATPPTAKGDGATWGADAANQAYITYRQPMRIAFLANALLG